MKRHWWGKTTNSVDIMLNCSEVGSGTPDSSHVTVPYKLSYYYYYYYYHYDYCMDEWMD